jgi:hypothetical protein
MIRHSPGGEVADKPEEDQPAIALIVAGSGETNKDEVYDLLEDAYPPKDYEEVGISFAADKDLFTPAVEHVIDWRDDEKALYPVKTEGAALTRKTSKFESTDVAAFTDLLDPKEWDDWDEVVFLIAMPEDDEDPDYDKYAGYVETAIDNGITVKNLSRGLDDVTLADEDDAAEPEPDPEPEPPKRQRRKKAEPKDEVEKEEEPPGETIEEQVEVARAQFASSTEKVGDLNTYGEGEAADARRQEVYEALGDVVEAVLRLRDLFAPILSPPDAEAVAALSAETKPEEDKDEKRGRGRPRTRFGVKQVWDDNEEEWIPRPAGRLKKGTKWRTVHAETDDVIEEGTA